MKIAITGGTGFIGTKLTSYLLEKGHEVYILSRKKIDSDEPNIHYVQWMQENSSPENELEGISAIVNLAGASINSRWTEEYKKIILNSRIKATNEVLRIISKLETKPSVLVNASAIGIYGHSLDKTFTEESSHVGDDFLAEVTKKWEETAQQATEYNVRTVFTRFGIVLGKDEGALPKMAIPYKMFIGGKLGSGRQWFSWIHYLDLVRMIYHVIENEEITGPVNGTAPEPLQMNEFGKKLGDALGKPHWFPTPGLPVKLALGEMSNLILKGQKVLPKKALDHEFKFLYPNLDKALEEIYN